MTRNVLLNDVTLLFGSEESYAKTVRIVSPDMDPVRRDVVGLTPLRIRQQFSTRISVSLPLSSIQAETASALAEAEGGQEICAADPQYTLSVASSLCISPEML